MKLHAVLMAKIGKYPQVLHRQLEARAVVAA